MTKELGATARGERTHSGHCIWNRPFAGRDFVRSDVDIHDIICMTSDADVEEQSAQVTEGYPNPNPNPNQSPVLTLSRPHVQVSVRSCRR